MHPELKIYIDRLHDGHTELLDQELSPGFIDVNETELKFRDAVQIQGQAYLADEHLVIQLSIKTKAVMPCSVCNKPVEVKIKIDRFYHTEELSKIKRKIYDFSEPLREAILLEVPSFTQCGGNCPKRKELNQYYHNEEDSEGQSYPFTELN